VSFAGAEIVFRELDAKANYLTRIGRDGTARQRIVETPIIDKSDSSPDGAWVVAIFSGEGEQRSTPGTTIRSIRGGPPTSICPWNCPTTFSADGRWMYVTLLGIGEQPGSGAKILAVRIGEKGELPASLSTVVGAAFAGTLPPPDSLGPHAIDTMAADQMHLEHRRRAGPRTFPELQSEELERRGARGEESLAGGCHPIAGTGWRAEADGAGHGTSLNRD